MVLGKMEKQYLYLGKVSGLIKTKIQGWASAIIDLAQPIEILRNNLHGKWRNALGRAERSNIEIW